MRYASPLISLEEVTERLRQLEDRNFPERDISEEKDRLFIQHFGCTRAELTGPIPPTKLLEITEWTYEQVVDLAVKHGFDITSSPEVMDDEHDSDENINTAIPDENYQDDEDQYEGDYGWVIEHNQEWIEMMVAKDMGLFPETAEELEQVRLSREAQRYARRAEQDRHRPINDGEAEQVFGRARDIREGTIAPTRRRGVTSVREVKVEVIRRRSYRS
jgi:hypothetical protein